MKIIEIALVTDHPKRRFAVAVPPPFTAEKLKNAVALLEDAEREAQELKAEEAPRQ